VAWVNHQVGSDAVAWASQVGWDMAMTIMEELPQFGGTDEAFTVLRMGTESTTLTALVLLFGRDDVVDVASPDALRGVDDWVRRGIGVDVILRGVRLGHAGMSAAFFAACETWIPAPQRTEAMREISSQLFRFIDAFSALMSQRYLTEHDRWVTSTAAARHDMVHELLASDHHVDLAAAVKVLAYDLTRWHVAVIAWEVGEDVHHRASGLQRAASDLLRGMGCTATLLVPVGGGLLWAWGSLRASPCADDHADPPAHQPLTTRGGDSPSPRGLRIAMGTPQRGASGFRRSHLQARAAHDLMRLRPTRADWLVRYDEVDVASLLIQDLERARDFVRAELGSLAGTGVQLVDLRRTLLVYLDEQNSPNAAARQLHVARNTVSYRVNRAEEFLGRPVSVRRRHLHVALWLAELMGAVVLHEPATKDGEEHP